MSLCQRSNVARGDGLGVTVPDLNITTCKLNGYHITQLHN